MHKSIHEYMFGFNALAFAQEPAEPEVIGRPMKVSGAYAHAENLAR